MKHQVHQLIHRIMITLSNASIKIIEHVELYIEQDMEEDAKHTGSQAH